MIARTLFLFLKHFFGLGTVAGIYTAQAFHIRQFIGLELIILVYLYALLAFYLIVYGFEAKILKIQDEDAKNSLKKLKTFLLAANLAFALVELINHSPLDYAHLFIIILKALFSAFAVVFTEKLLSIIFAVETVKTQPQKEEDRQISEVG